ncbi:vacuolar protein sorting-associated protein 18 homolog isoform X2 [Bacillus rossius redtenbacheri]|uniref:vacuolar protein sorting-associated protein 18 homolog isoform X2 n=1 Tax=Bacillus rossius redtenbacheri TaxID=93214 RepID=UPI002FDD42F3
MTSLFDQYEQASQRFRGSAASTIRPEMSTTGFIHMKLEEDPPIFSKQKVNFTPTDRVTHLRACSDLLVLTMANNLLLRIDLRNPDKPEEIDLSKHATTSLRLSSVFLDPLGQHSLLSFAAKTPDAAPDLVYLARRSSKLKQLHKFKGHEVTAVGWNYRNESDSTTGPILLGTSKGLIFETEIVPEGDRIFQSGLEQYLKQVFDIGKGSVTQITGLEFHRVPGSDKYFVLVTTPSRLYQFIGYVSNSEEKPLLQQIFNSYLTVPESFQEIPSSLKYSKLQFLYQNLRGLPKMFAWLTEPGIFYGQLDPSGQASVLTKSELLQYPAPSPGAPLSFVLTEFHALLLYTDHVKGVSLLNEELVFEDYYNEAFGKLVDITKDPIRGTIWVFAEKAVFRFKVMREERNVWQIYMEKGEFDLAKKYCGDNPAHLDQVLVKQAEMYFNTKMYKKSALHYAETQSSFEEVALKFLQVSEIDALKTFLIKKLEGLRPQDKTQITMIVMLVLELTLNQLGCLRDQGEEGSAQYSQLQKELDSFLARPEVTECVKNNHTTMYDLMASHGDKQNLVKLTIINKDYERVIRHHINKNNHLEALDVLKSQTRKELFYQFAPALMQANPKQTVQVLISQGRNLNPSKLLPALVTCDENQAGEAIRYLEFAIHSLNCQQQAVHNYLLSLYACHKPDKLMHYLAVQGQDALMIHYDVHYALRLCRERGLAQACVQLSALLGLWESAVDLALTVSVDLAKQTASMPQNDTELRKKLWLKIVTRSTHLAGPHLWRNSRRSTPRGSPPQDSVAALRRSRRRRTCLRRGSTRRRLARNFAWNSAAPPTL